MKLVSDKFYDGQRVHAWSRTFVVQFGDPQSKTLPLD
jgi:cyclophilin family peptidyl-prolyl cis-trans isomerase